MSAFAKAVDVTVAGGELSFDDAMALATAEGDDLKVLVAAADTLRREQAGDVVTYVVNRNVNFTNACTKACRFCAFSRGHRSEEAYYLDDDEIVRRAVEARDLGATEVCIQAGLDPQMKPDLYERLCVAIKRVAPELHLHAFSPEEIKYGAKANDVSFHDYLARLKDVGLGSLPGTSAEILGDESLRHRLAPGRITTAEWIDVIRSAHSLGLPTTSTMMFGHIETPAQQVNHLFLLRDLQRETGGFTEFVPLSFVADEAPMVKKGLVPGLSHGPGADDVIRVHALSRMVLGKTFRNVQASWVKEGLSLATTLLSAGVNDLGGTLMNESISTSAGAGHGQLMSPRILRGAIEKAGRVPQQRDTRYRPIETAGPHPLDAIEDAESTFGSFHGLIKDDRYRLSLVRPRRAAG
jgi:FO synthase subunit 2